MPERRSAPRLAGSSFLILALRAGRLVECLAKATGKSQCIIIGPEMEEEQARLVVQHVAVYGGYVDVVRSQRSDHRIHLIAGEYEIPSDSCFAITRGLKTNGYRHAHRPDRTDLHAFFGDRITAWHRELIDAAVCLSFDADDLI